MVTARTAKLADTKALARLRFMLAGAGDPILPAAAWGPVNGRQEINSRVTWDESTWLVRSAVSGWRLVREHHAPKGPPTVRIVEPLGAAVWLLDNGTRPPDDLRQYLDLAAATIYARDQEPELLGDGKPAAMHPHSLHILRTLATTPLTTWTQAKIEGALIRGKSSLSLNTIRKRLGDLRDAGLCERPNGDRGGDSITTKGLEALRTVDCGKIA